MAKDITEIINAASVVRDETGEAANTAARVGGSIAEIAQYIKDEIITPLLAAQSQAVSAERIAEYAKKIAEEAALKISTAIADKDYCLRNIYFLQEGIGCAAFDYAMSLGDVPVQSEEVTRQDGDSIILDTSANRFVLERGGKFYTKFLSNGASLQGWDVYANIRHTFLNRQDKSYWYRKEDGTLTQGSSTFVIGKWLKELQGYADFSETEITQHASRITGLEERVLQYLYPKLYQLNEGAGARVFHGFTKATGEGGLIHTKDTYRYSVLYSTTQKRFVLNVTDEASGVKVLYSLWPKISLPNNKSIASSESYVPRDCLYSIYVDGEGSTYYYIDSEGNALEQSATYLLRRLVDKNASAIAALLTKNTEQDEKIAGLKSALVSQSLSQVQENIFALCDSDGNIALKYDNSGFDVANISEHFSSLLSNSISGLINDLRHRIQGRSENSSAYTDPFISLGNSTDWEEFSAKLDVLSEQKYMGRCRATVSGANVEVYQFVNHFETSNYTQVVLGNVSAGENGQVKFTPNSFNIMYRQHKDGAWSAWQHINNVEKELEEYKIALQGLSNSVSGLLQSLSQVQENMFALCDSDGNIALKYDDLGFDVAKISEHFSSLLSNSISRKNLLQVIEVDEPGLYYVDAELNVGEKRDKTGTHAINLVEYINQ